MRTTIAKKKNSVGAMYIALTLAGLGMIIYAFSKNMLEVAVFAALIAIISAVLSVRYLSLPQDIFVLSGDNTLILPKEIVVSLDSVSDVSYRCATAKGIQYKWGTIIISTESETYKYGFVEDCEDVAKHLTKLMYAAKIQKEQSYNNFV